MCRVTVEVDLAGDAERPETASWPEGEADRRRLDGVGFIILSTVSL